MQIYSVLALFLGTAMSAAVERDVSPGNVLMERQALDCAVGLTGSAFCGACRVSSPSLFPLLLCTFCASDVS